MEPETIDSLYYEFKKLAGRMETRGCPFIRVNSKTGLSMDRDSNCPKREAGNRCPYCYVRDLETLKYCNGSDYLPRAAQVTDEMRQGLHDFANELRRILRNHGTRIDHFSLRTFSLSDFRPEHRAFWREIWDYLRLLGVRCHVVTKQLDYVPFMAQHVENVQVSVDTLDKAHRRRAYKLAKQYPNVYLRAVELNNNDRWIRQYVDILTIFHGRPIDGIETYRTSGRSHKALCQRIQKETTARVCCGTGKCISCRKCWIKQEV